MLPLLMLVTMTAAPDCLKLFGEAKPADDAALEELRCAPWKELVVVAVPLRRPSEPPPLEVVAMRGNAVFARLVDEGGAENYSVYGAPVLKFDLAAFKEPDGSPAFGVRVENRLLVSSVTDGESSTLNVYALQENGLKRVVKRLLALESTSGSVCNDCDCGASKLTRTLSYDAKNVLTVKTTRVGWVEEKKNGKCGRKDVTEKPMTERLEVKDGEFVVPESMSAE